MSEPPGATSVLGIEGVEWLAEGGENLTVRVTGRWRRRRPAWSAQPTLVIEAPGRRYRFPAIAEPPSLSGAGPGTWRISFAVPASLAPELGGRAWLQFGAVVVPLPTGVSPPAPAAGGTIGGAPPPELAAEPEPTALPEPRPAVEPAAPAAERGAGLEDQLREARLEAERLAAVLSDQQLSRRAAEQGARAERALRTDLGRQLNEARQRLTEAEQTAAAAVTARERAEEKLAASAREREDRRREGAPAAQVRRLSLEQELISRRGPAARIPREPLAFSAATRPASSQPMPGLGSAAVASGGARAMTDALRQELAARAMAEAGLHSRLIDAEARLAAREAVVQRTSTVLRALRDELDELRAELGRERTARQAAEARAERLRSDLGGARTRSLKAHQSIAELRATLEALRGPLGGGPSPEGGAASAAGGVEPDRLSAALVRLREQIAPQEGPDAPAADHPAAERRGGPAAPERPAGPPAPERPAGPPERPSAGSSQPAPAVAAPDPGPITVGRPWLRAAFRALARSEPGRAGELILALLPAQRAVLPGPVAYDLQLGGVRGCLRVTVRGGSSEIISADTPRNLADVDFRFTGEPADLARLIRAGRLRRRFGRRVGRVQGRRAGLAALDALVASQLGLGALLASGVRLDPRTALSLLAKLIPAAWTEPERFALAYVTPGRNPIFMLVDGRQPIEVTELAPRVPATTTISGPDGTLERVLGDEPSAAAAVDGDSWPVTLLREWVKRAQSG